MWGEEHAGLALLRGEAPPPTAPARQADAALQDLQSRLARDLEDALLLQGASTRLIEADNVDGVHEQLLDAAVSIMRSDFGTVQVLDGTLGVLKLLTSKGFEPGTAAAWAQLGADSASACGAAWRQGTRIVVHDVEEWAPLSGTPELEYMRRCGVRSMQSTPLCARDGRLVGMLSTQWRVPRVPTQRELRLLDVIARQAADLIERRRSEECLRESEVRLRLLIESVAQAVWETDAAGIVKLDSPSWRSYTGQSLQQWLGGGWIDAIHPEDREFAYRNWTDCVRERRNVDAEFRLQHADGTWRWTNVKAMPLVGTDGSVHKWIGMNVDVSERKNAELALRDVDRRKDEFLATLAHELRNPLAPLRHGIQISRLTGGNDTRQQAVMDRMDRQLTHLVRLVDDLLDVGRIRSGKLVLQRHPVDVTGVLQTSFEAIRDSLAAKRQELQWVGLEVPLRVFGDYHRLVQVFTNLLSNAAKYSEAGSIIEVQVERADDAALVRVIDQGIGIPAAELQNVFNLFSQVRAHQGRADGGLGIGLSLVRSLVVLHEGTVTAESGGTTLGSRFTVRLPLAPGQAVESAPEPAPAQLAPGLAVSLDVLVVDDNADAGDSLAMLLQLMGHDVRVARDGFEAVAQTRLRSPDLVLLDLGMPRMDGIETARHLRTMDGGNRCFIAALTGWGQATDRQRTRDAGFDLHLVKPIDEPTLLDALQRVALHRAGQPPP